eukprot:INCI14549.2.p1 GENE.INCI14549.2~~INCI14549.2.p1  ORF type:complete len:380 (+),score=52.27 INCI14549.2:108-1142(+)
MSDYSDDEVGGEGGAAGPSSSDDEIIGRARKPKPAPIDTNPLVPKTKTNAERLAELRSSRLAATGGATPGAGGRGGVAAAGGGTPSKKSLGSAALDRLRAQRAAQSPGGRLGATMDGAPPERVTAAGIAMNNAQNIWNETMSTLRINQRKHAVHKQAEKRPDPELHIIGEIMAASGFGPHGVSCRYEFVTVAEEDTDWTLLGGEAKSQTQFGYPRNAKSEAPLCHPIDLHYTTQTLEHWPRMVVQVWQIDSYNCSNLVGYGVGSIPCQSGHFSIDINTWKPIGSSKDEVSTFFLGNSQVLASDLLVYEKAETERCLIQTIPSGTIHVNLSVMMRNFDDFFLDKQ